MGNSYKQLKTAEIMAKCSGTLSVIGSTWIIVEILRKPRRLRTTLLQILLGMSVYDIGASTWYIIGSWAIPRDTEGNVFMPRGNDRTCHMQGFLFQTFASAIPMYNLSLAVYYYLTVNGGWKEDRMKKWWWAFHVLPCTFGLVTATYGLAADQFNPNELWCWFSGTEQSDVLKFLLYYGPLWVVFFIIVILFILMYRHVRKQEVANQRYQFQSKVMEDVSSLSNAQLSQMLIASRRFSAQKSRELRDLQQQQSDADLSSSHNVDSSEYVADEMSSHDPANSLRQASVGGRSSRSRSRRNMINSIRASNAQSQAKLSRPVFVQGLLFACVFVLTFLFPTLTRAQQLHKDEIRFGTLFCMTLFLPMQGFFNFLVFKRMEIVKFFRRCRQKKSWQTSLRPLTKSSKTASEATTSRVSQTKDDEADPSARAFDPTDALEPLDDEGSARKMYIGVEQPASDLLDIVEEEDEDGDAAIATGAAVGAATAAAAGAANLGRDDSDCDVEQPQTEGYTAAAVPEDTESPTQTTVEEPTIATVEEPTIEEEQAPLPGTETAPTKTTPATVVPTPPAQLERDAETQTPEVQAADQHDRNVALAAAAPVALAPAEQQAPPPPASSVEEHEQYLAGAILDDDDAPEITFVSKDDNEGDEDDGTDQGLASILA